MKVSQKLFAISIIIFLGLTPLVWLKDGNIIAKGDYFPAWLNPSRTLSNHAYLWSTNNMGNPNIMSSFLPYEVVWLSLRSLELNAGLIQIFFQIFFFMGAGLSMYYLSKTVYPNFKLVPLVSSIFYMFNFVVLRSRVLDGMAWLYVFLPLLMALLIKIMNATCQQNSKATNKNIIYFAIASTITFFFASVNLSNVVIAVLILAILSLYYLISQKNRIRQLLQGIIKLTAISIPLNVWWIIPTLNYYLWSPSQLNPEISVTAWSWTQSRASFLNLFWLNGAWDWRPEYVPYLNSYSNPLLVILTFIPFFLAATALLFKTNKSRFNAYIMLAILAFLFLAKGIHEPLSGLNILLYTYIPGMSMFREPVSKFTMALMPFLALLIGYAVHHIVNIKVGKHKPTNLTKAMVTTCFILVFIIGSYPLVTNPMETKTPQLPYSSYVKIPDYWYKATDWLNNQPDDYKILITPPDDFYQMPYTWGYYGTEDFLASFIQKPILLTYYAPYIINPETAATLDYLGKTISDNRTDQFKALLDLLNVRYILQRNDVQSNFTGSNILSRNILSSDEMQTFLTQQPYIHLAQKFGQLDIYEYTDPKPYIYILNPTTLQQTTIKIENITTVDSLWDFTSIADVDEWRNVTPQVQFGANQSLSFDNGALKAELWNSTWDWKEIDSPILPAQYGNTYQIQMDVKGQNADAVHVKTVEFDANKNVLAVTYSTGVGDGTFGWTHTVYTFEPTNMSTKYLQIQVWHGHETDKPLPNIIWIDNVQIQSYTTILNTTGINLIFQNATQNQPATIISYEKINPTKITSSINATQPFILAISEALDQSWTAHINGKQYKPIPLYLDLKGFYINETGLLEITIEYEPQRWFFYGSAISLTALILCTLYISKDKIKIIYRKYIKKKGL